MSFIRITLYEDARFSVGSSASARPYVALVLAANLKLEHASVAVVVIGLYELDGTPVGQCGLFIMFQCFHFFFSFSSVRFQSLAPVLEQAVDMKSRVA